MIANFFGLSLLKRLKRKFWERWTSEMGPKNIKFYIRQKYDKYCILNLKLITCPKTKTLKLLW